MTSLRSKLFGALAVSWMTMGIVPANAADKVNMGMIGSFGDAPIFLAIERGYFTAAGIEPVMEYMGSLPKMIAPLGSGQLDVAFGAINAGLYNAIGRNVTMKVVADKGRNAPGYAYNLILVRKDLFDGGTVKSLADLKGRKIATIGMGTNDMSTLNEAMKTAGLTYDSLVHSAMPLPNHSVSLQNKALDATLTPEPVATIMIEKGLAVKLASVSDFYPDQQQSVMVYSSDFISKRRDVAQRFMNAYLRGVRAYMAALNNGRLTGPNSDEVIAAVLKHTKMQDAELLKRSGSVPIDPDGKVNLGSIEKDWEFLKSRNLITSSITPKDLVDMSFSETAAKELGPYKKP